MDVKNGWVQIFPQSLKKSVIMVDVHRESNVQICVDKMILISD